MEKRCDLAGRGGILAADEPGSHAGAVLVGSPEGTEARAADGGGRVAGCRTQDIGHADPALPSQRTPVQPVAGRGLTGQ